MARQPRVHVLGLGSIGTFAAHSLAEIPGQPMITLLCHRPSLLQEYIKNGRKISLKTVEGPTVSHGGYNLEVLRDGQWYLPSLEQDPIQLHPDVLSRAESPVSDIIENLIISVKATQTVDALRPLKQRLTAQSTIMFLQNGSGMIEAVNEKLFSDPQTRPNYITGIISHGVSLNSAFNITHTGFSATSIGLVPRSAKINDDLPTKTEDSYLLNALPLVPRLNAKSYCFTDVLQIQLEKLALNAFCNPLCALNDSKNGFLLTIPETRRTILTEISNVVRALPELRNIPGIDERFAVDRLETTVNTIIMKTCETTCSMVWDLRAGRGTEIEFINGYWSRRGREVGVATPVNDSLVQRINSKRREEGQNVA
jgi:2-dehydropantoate 2-reductase